jgi:serine/threonine protein kinase
VSEFEAIVDTNHFRIVREIARGGMGAVYEAVQVGTEGFEKRVALKVILSELTSDRDFVNMFIGEAKLVADLVHENIVQIYEFGQVEGSYFLAMEYLHGKDLLSVLRQLRGLGRLMMPADAAYIAHAVAAGLSYAHTLVQAGKTLDIIHRDVSPSNIMLLREGGVKLLDFGIAKAATEVLRHGTTTETGSVKGKLSYLSPEQVRGDPIDARSDIFSLGVVLWECITGKRLFFDKAEFDTMKNVLERPIPPPSTLRSEVPTALDAITLRALGRQLDNRYPSAAAMAEDLESYLQVTRHSASALPRLLNGLYGKETPEAATGSLPAEQRNVHDTTEMPLSALPLDFDDIPMPAASADSLAPVPVESPPSPGTAPPAPPASGARDRRRQIVWVGAAAACALIVGFGTGWRPRPQPGATMPLVSAVPTPPVKSMVSFKIESDPTEAEVHGRDGALLGLTPLTFTLPIGSETVVIRVEKAGFQSSRISIVPDRDLTAFLSLRLLLPAAPAPPVAHERISAGSTRRIVNPTP